MSPDSNNRINIVVGKGVTRRQVMKQASVAMGSAGMASLTGCSSLGGNGTEGADGGGDGGDGGDGGGGTGSEQTSVSEADASAQGAQRDPEIVELVPPPTELDYSQLPPERHMTMVVHIATATFFVPVIAGLHDAAGQVGWTVNFTGPEEYSPQAQADIINSAIDSGADAIATNIVDDQAFDDVLQRVIDNDIILAPFNTVAYTDQQWEEKFGRVYKSVAQNLVDSGYVSGLQMLEYLPDDAKKVAIASSTPSANYVQARSQGMREALSGTGVSVDQTINITTNASEGVSKLEDYLTANPDAGGILGVDAFAFMIGQAIDNQGLQGEVYGGGFDVNPDILQQIQDGLLSYTIGQDPYSQGYITAVQVWEYLERGVPRKNYRTGSEVIDAENVDFVQDRSNWGELREFQQQNYDTTR